MIGGPTPLSLEGARALPPVDRSAMPPDVRRGTPEQQRAYRAALGFERMLIGQLVKTMAEAAKPAGDEDESASAATSTYRDLFSDSLADNVARAGGMGLAEHLYRQMTPGAAR